MEKCLKNKKIFFAAGIRSRTARSKAIHETFRPRRLHNYYRVIKLYNTKTIYSDIDNLNQRK